MSRLSPFMPDHRLDANLSQKNAWTLDKLGNWDEFVKRTNGTEITEPRTNNKANEYLTIDPDGSGGSSPLTLVHDQNGNLTDDGTYLYEYDIENRMTRVKLKSGSVTLADYHYDALGRRIRKIIPSGTDAGTWTYVINELWQVVSEYKTVSSTTTHQRRYVHAGQSAYVDDHVAMWSISGSKLYFYHADAQYCTVAMTQETNGDVDERYVTDPYGKAVTYDGSWASPQATSRLGNPFMHQGLWFDGECGKYQNRRREYLPTLGQFAQRDPLGYIPGLNLYAYLQNYLLTSTDPSGLMAMSCIQTCVTMLLNQTIPILDVEFCERMCSDERASPIPSSFDGPPPNFPNIPPVAPPPLCPSNPGPNSQGCPISAPGTGSDSWGDGWCSEGHNSLHKPAKECYRGLGGNSGAQCCYDSNGCLIPDNAPGAGTWDNVNPAYTEDGQGNCIPDIIIGVPGHFVFDVCRYFVGEFFTACMNRPPLYPPGGAGL